MIKRPRYSVPQAAVQIPHRSVALGAVVSRTRTAFPRDRDVVTLELRPAAATTAMMPARNAATAVPRRVRVPSPAVERAAALRERHVARG